MEHDQLKSEDQMEFMMMMQQMERIPEFCSAYNDHLSTASGFRICSNISTSEPHCFDNFQAVFPPPTTVSLANTNPTNHEPRAPFSATSRWRNSVLSGDENASFPPESQKQSSVAAMREMIFRIAVMQPIHIDPEAVKPPKRRNVKISTDPQSVAARHRRERISERIRILQRLVPGGTKMDTASMLDEAIHYVKFLKTQVQSLERAAANRPISTQGIGFPLQMSSGINVPTIKPSRMPQNVEEFGDA